MNAGQLDPGHLRGPLSVATRAGAGWSRWFTGITAVVALTLAVPVAAFSADASAAAPMPITTEILAGGDPRMCALKPDGSADCWGSDAYGQAAADQTATIAADKELGAGSLGNTASTSTDGSVANAGIDVTAPTVVSIGRLDPVPTRAVTVRYRVDFSEPVTGVDFSDFSLTTTGTLSGNRITDVAGSGTQRVVTLTTEAATGSGTIVLNVVDDDTIIDAANNPLGGRGSGNGNFTTNDEYLVAWPNLTISKTHTGNFAQGQTGATYTITVANTGSFWSVGGATVVDTLPAGLTATAIDGSGWACTLATLTCTTSDHVPANTVLPAITVTVDVAANAPAAVTNTATLTAATLAVPLIASDPTTIIPVVVAPTVALIPDPCIAGKTALLVTGTDANEYFSLKLATGGKIQVAVNSKAIGTYNPTGTLIVLAGNGTNRVVVESAVALPQLLYGGTGPDNIQAGKGRAVMIGGGGDDTLYGYVGRDIAIGGTGADTLKGRDNDDILIAGSSAFDEPTTANIASLCAIHNEWARTDAAYAARISHLLGTSAGGLNGSNTLRPGVTVTDDTSTDILQGDSGIDWHIANRIPPGAVLDTLLSRSSSETLSEL